MQLRRVRERAGAVMTDAIHRAEHAKRLLDDDLLKEALNTLKTETQALFFELPTGDAQAREKLHLMDKMRQQFENILTAIIVNGEVTQYGLLAEEHAKAAAQAIKERVRQR
jgi:hypothetical protein